ncbi:hypothetical protein [Brevundimonas diminuta]|uniref:hypothetical protein n=1 Tax=Brevundimonas diminuta TaxID=293 RepID=UPI003D060FB8
MLERLMAEAGVVVFGAQRPALVDGALYARAQNGAGADMAVLLGEIGFKRDAARRIGADAEIGPA